MKNPIIIKVEDWEDKEDKVVEAIEDAYSYWGKQPPSYTQDTLDIEPVVKIKFPNDWLKNHPKDKILEKAEWYFDGALKKLNSNEIMVSLYTHDIQIEEKFPSSQKLFYSDAEFVAPIEWLKVIKWVESSQCQ